ncbi:MAG: carbohydrate porin [Phycisphaerales bacterium]
MFPSKSLDIVLAVIGVSIAVPSVLAQDKDPALAPPAPAEAAAEPPAAAEPHAPAGLVPLIDYTGDLWTRPRLLGDFGGARTDWANKGIQFDINFTQIVQSVVEGGLDTATRYGGTLDYNVLFDLHRMGVMPGAIVKFRAESRYGDSVNDITGQILSANSDAFFPFTHTLDQDIPITITDLAYTQFLSEHIGFLIGKFDTIDADPNEFASGRGTSQFMNANFTFCPAISLMAPYSTLGAGIIVKPTHAVKLSSVVYNIKDSSTTSGFEDIGNGAAWVTSAEFEYTLGELPGGQNVTFGYAFDTNFVDLDDRFVFTPGQGLAPTTKDSTWAVTWSGWQYLWVKDPSDAPINLANGEPDRQGLGLFARAGFADQDTNPIEWSASGGVGGKGIIPGRERDTFGVGYFYLKYQPERLIESIGVDNHSQGFEAFYNVSITPAVNLSLDVQVLESPLPDVDTAVILGLRLGLKF